MQRKNSLLKNKKNGFAMIMAITVIVIIATIMALSLTLTSKTTKRTTDVYLYEQAELYAKAASEIALLNIAKQGCNGTNNPLIIPFGNNPGEIQYDANVTMQYVFTNNSGPAGCTKFTTTTPVTTPEQNGSVVMDIAVTLHDSSITTEPIRYFRRTIQKL